MASDSGLTRFEFDGKVTHRKGQQFVDGRGYGADGFEEVHRPEPHGFASHPVKGGIGVLVQSRANRDAAYILGGEHPGLRPKGDFLTPGGTALYDHLGNIVSVVAAKLRIVHASRIHLIAPEIILEGLCLIGGPDASRPASAQGTIDTAGHLEVGNLATMVLVK